MIRSQRLSLMTFQWQYQTSLMPRQLFQNKKCYPGTALGNFFCFLILTILSLGCENGPPPRPSGVYIPPPDETQSYILPEIDLRNWKVTLPIPRNDGKPLEVTPPEILNYATNEILKPFMYNDSTDGSLVFYTYPGSSTANSSYSRTELRELMDGGDGKVNWTFGQGGFMRGTLSVPEISTDLDGDPHRTMIMQIHGRLTDQQRDLIGEDDNNAPPILKIYWQDDKVRVITKKLKNINDSNEEALYTSAWTDDESRYFTRKVGTEKFTLQVIASDGKIEVSMDDDETFIFETASLDRWGVFENYFKAGNYLGTTDEGAFAKVKYYDLVATHD